MNIVMEPAEDVADVGVQRVHFFLVHVRIWPALFISITITIFMLIQTSFATFLRHFVAADISATIIFLSPHHL